MSWHNRGVPLTSTPPASSPGWFVAVPLKGGAGAKSRLAPVGRSGLARAMAADTLMAVVAVVGRDRTLVVTSDDEVCRLVTSLGVVTIADPGRGLDAAGRAGIEAAWARGATAVAILLGDHPALRPAELEAALEAAARHTWAFVPDDDGEGTAMVTTTSGLPPLAFGARSARRHEASGLVRLDLDLPGLRVDVDTVADLAAAQAIGVGARSVAVLGRD